MAKWKKIKDKNVKMFWKCPFCNFRFDTSPAVNGNDMIYCEHCGTEASYRHTEIKQTKIAIFERMAVSLESIEKKIK